MDREIIKKYADGNVYMLNDKSIQGILIDEITTLSKIKKKDINEKYSNKKMEYVGKLM